MDKNQLQALYDRLPEAIKSVYDRPETNDEIYEIGDKYKLHIDQIGVIIKTAYAVMLGIVKPTDFTSTFAKEADIPEDIANLITHDINEQVFAPIRQELMRGGQSESMPGASKPLPRNVEPIGSQFSSAPYQPERPEDPARQQILTAIENPTPTKMITRDNFTTKLGQLSQSQETGLSKTSTGVPKVTTEKKVDPYLEPIN